jgi:hypothetical protein
VEDDIRLLNQLRLEGKCCASIIVQAGLFLRGEENEQLAASVAGLCNGLHFGLLCGALGGAACMLSLFGDDAGESSRMVSEMSEWFDSVCKEKYGGSNCSDITRGDPLLRFERCPALIEAAYVRAKSILEDYGKILD